MLILCFFFRMKIKSRRFLAIYLSCSIKPGHASNPPCCRYRYAGNCRFDCFAGALCSVDYPTSAGCSHRPCGRYLSRGRCRMVNCAARSAWCVASANRRSFRGAASVGSCGLLGDARHGPVKILGAFAVNANLNAVAVHQRFGFETTVMAVRTSGLVFQPMRRLPRLPDTADSAG